MARLDPLRRAIARSPTDNQMARPDIRSMKQKQTNTTSISVMIHKKHIYRFALHTTVHSLSDKTTIFSG